MKAESQEILNRARQLPAIEQAQIVDELLAGLDRPDSVIDSRWREEVEARIAAFNAGQMSAAPLEEVLAKYRK